MMDFYGFIKIIKSKHGIDLLKYKESRIKKRTGQFMMRKNINNYDDLIASIEGPDNFEEFLQFQRINISYFLRDRKLFYNLIHFISSNPHTFKTIKDCGILSIGCSKGEEIYSLLFLMEYHNLDFPGRIIGIDSDEKQLLSAREARWHKNSVQEYDLLMQKYLRINPVNDNEYRLEFRPDLNIEFRQFDVMKKNITSLGREFGLILCRNFMIYLNNDFKSRLLKDISCMLETSGILFIGSSEYIHHPEELGLKYINHSVYRKL